MADPVMTKFLFDLNQIRGFCAKSIVHGHFRGRCVVHEGSSHGHRRNGNLQKRERQGKILRKPNILMIIGRRHLGGTTLAARCSVDVVEPAKVRRSGVQAGPASHGLPSDSNFGRVVGVRQLNCRCGAADNKGRSRATIAPTKGDQMYLAAGHRAASTVRSNRAVGRLGRNCS